VGSSCIRGWTNVSCFGRQILYHWASREDLTELFYNRLSLDSLWFLHRNPQTHIAYEGTELLLRFPIFPSSPSCISGDCLLKLTLHSNLGTTSYFEFCIFQSNERYSSPVVTYPIPNLLFKCSNYLKKKVKQTSRGFPWWYSGWEFTCQCRGHGFNPWSGKVTHALEPLSPGTTTMEFLL